MLIRLYKANRLQTHTREYMAHIVSLADTHQESTILVLICQKMTEALNPVHFAKEPPDKNDVIKKKKTYQRACWKFTKS